MALLIPGVGLVDASGTLLIPGAGIVEQAAAAGTEATALPGVGASSIAGLAPTLYLERVINKKIVRIFASGFTEEIQ